MIALIFCININLFSNVFTVTAWPNDQKKTQPSILDILDTG